MSAFLGPIHFWLYNKIQFQESLIDELIRYASSQGWSDSDLADKYGSKDRRKLDEVIDESNIHGLAQGVVAVTVTLPEFAVQVHGPVPGDAAVIAFADAVDLVAGHPVQEQVVQAVAYGLRT